jgi:hypothetical protein
LLLIIHLVLRANLTREPRLPGWSWMITAVYLAFTATWIVMMIVRFYRIPKQ